jgi:hypothetical protein
MNFDLELKKLIGKSVITRMGVGEHGMNNEIA